MKISSSFFQIFGHIQMLNGFEKNLHSGREKPRGTFKMLVEKLKHIYST